jgi:hypothetical protein
VFRIAFDALCSARFAAQKDGRQTMHFAAGKKTFVTENKNIVRHNAQQTMQRAKSLSFYS